MSTTNGTKNRQQSIRKPNPPVQDSIFQSFRLDGRTVIITGGCGGIGYEIARGLAEAGANLALWYHTSPAHQKIQAKISQDFGVKVQTYQVDIRKYKEVEAAVAQVVKDFGKLDVMIANAGIPTKAGGLDDRIEDWENVRATDFDGTYYCMRAAGLVFREQKRGVGIITASMSGHAANVPQEQSCYNACKAGCIHLGKSLAVEWAKWGGRVNSVSPGYIDTIISGDCPFEMKEEWFSLTPMMRDADPRELKGIYLYLASDASSYTTGADFIVDGGLQFLQQTCVTGIRSALYPAMSTQIRKDAQIVGTALAEVLPQTNKWWFQQPHLLRLNLLLLIPLLSSSVSGYDGSLMNGVQSLHQWQDYFGNPAGQKLGLVNAAQSIGSVVALPFVGTLSDKFGRKPILLSGLILIIIASAIQASSINYAMFVVSRLIVGFGGMFVVQPSPMLIAELAYPTHRGKLTSAFWTFYYLGAILASWTTFGTQNYLSTVSWRLPSAMQSLFPIVQLVFFWFLPESPRWLVAQDRTHEAATLLTKYHDPETENSPLIHYELNEIVQTIQHEKVAKSTGWSALISTPGNRKRTLIAVCTGGFAQWNGIGVVSYYLTLVLNTVGITDTFDQTLINGLLQIFNFGAALSAAFLVDRLGRRTLFLWSGFGMLVSYVVWTACSAVNSETGSKPAGIIVVVCLFAFFFHYDIAWTPLLFGYPTEIFPYYLRSKGIAVELFAIYGSLVVQAFVNPIGLDRIGWKYYIVFCCTLVVFLFVTYFLFPETKGYSLEEIARIFDGDDAVPEVKGLPVGAEHAKEVGDSASHCEKV
ncbi:hypothetical protein G7046_g3867 [Stylonectria norvegica]|nr:hypothetical protein G7046_g3867 [Stylonectria norvegica]